MWIEAKLMSMIRVTISSSVPVLWAASSITHCSISFLAMTIYVKANRGVKIGDLLGVLTRRR